MRKLLSPALLATLAVSAGLLAGSASSRPLAANACAAPIVHKGTLTIGTDNPAYPPWYGGNSGHGWKVSDPYSGKGYESAVTYALAAQLGYTHAKVKWTYVPFLKSFAPGRKGFDFDINQISYTPARAKVVDFSTSYYDVNQALVVLKGTKIAAVNSIAGLKPYKLGAQLGTTSYAFIKSVIKPSQQPAVYPTNAGAVLALRNKQIDGLMVDLPTAFYVTAVQVPNSKILGQFENHGQATDHFGVVLQKGNPLTACVNKAITTLRTNGTLKKLQALWLAKATGAPVLK